MATKRFEVGDRVAAVAPQGYGPTRETALADLERKVEGR